MNSIPILRAAAALAGLALAGAAAAGPVTHFVTVESNVFTPEELTIQVGDTVVWDNVQGFHDVEPCDGVSDPPQCGGQVAVEPSFGTGGPAFAPWSYQKTFNTAGDNPYFCSVHVGLGMAGSVTVQESVGPPGVPDGTDGAPLVVARLAADASSLGLSWDTVVCAGAVGHRIVYGGRSDLPPAPGGTYATRGAACGAGLPPYTWNGSPDPAVVDPASRTLWFLVLATNGGPVEGAWGADSAGSERTGPGPGGSSAVCGATAKDLSNACP